MHLKLSLSIITTVFILVSCTNVRQIEFAQSIEHPENAHPAPIKFTNLRLRIPVGAEIGVHRTKCFLSFFEVGRNYLRGSIQQPLINDAFAQTLEMQGFDVVSRLNTNFIEEYEADFLRSEYKISAKIIDAEINVCGQSGKVLSVPIFKPIYMGTGGFKGKLYLKIEWAVYDSLRQKVAYKTTTEGYINSKVTNREGITLMMNEAFSMAAHNLAAESAFHDLIFYGIKPPQNWRKKRKEDNRPRIYDRQEKVVIDNPELSITPIVKHIGKTSKVGVLVQAGAGHGSGFFITKQGHIITNAHVVGNAMRVRVVTSGNDKKLIAEVLRVNTKRDVALLKLEEIPDDLDIITLPIKTEWAKVSEDIYALGAPENKRMQDTLSKGIVSSHRKKFSVFGTKLDFIQGDITIRGGNSGGALFDANGNIIGIAVIGMYRDIGEGDSGLNLFIPIEDALKYLNIGLR